MKVKFEIPDYQDRRDLIRVLALNGYPVIAKTVEDGFLMTTHRYIVVEVPGDDVEDDNE